MPEARIVWRGKQLNKRTVAMIEAAEKLYRSKFAILQGSYNAVAEYRRKRNGYTIVA